MGEVLASLVLGIRPLVLEAEDNAALVLTTVLTQPRDIMAVIIGWQNLDLCRPNAYPIL